jgi:hypothetical protein
MGADTYFGFMAYVGNGEVDILPDLDRGLAQAGFALSGATGGLDDFRRTYASPSGPVIRCCGSVGGLDSRPGWTGKWTSWAFFPIEYSELGAFAEGQLAMAIRQACVETRTMLGRSFHPGGGGGMDRSELDGRVDYVDWAQYYGPDVSAALGADRISDAGFHSVERLPNGAHLALTRPGYLDRWPIDERRPLLDRLGIVPRLLFHKHLDGHVEEMRWC